MYAGGQLNVIDSGKIVLVTTTFVKISRVTQGYQLQAVYTNIISHDVHSNT